MSEIVPVCHGSPYRRRISIQPWYTASHIKVLAGGAGNRLLSRSGFPVAFSAPLLILCRKIPGHLFWLRPQAAFCKMQVSPHSSTLRRPAGCQPYFFRWVFMNSTISVVLVPGPKISSMPLALSFGTSSSGMIPPPIINTSETPCSLKISATLGNK
jgi:hypothetical protein